MPSCININYIKEGHAILIRLIYTIEIKDFKVYIEVDKGVKVGEENSCNTAIKAKLDTAPEAFAFELVC